MTTSHTKPLSAFGFAIIPVSEYQDLVSGNQTKGDLAEANAGLRDRIKMITEGRDLNAARLYDANERIKSLEQENRSFEATRVLDLAQLNSLKLQVKKLEQGDHASNELITDLEAVNDRHCATITELLSQLKKLEEGDRTNNEIIDHLNAEMVVIRQNLNTTQKDIDAIKETYHKTLAANSALDKKLSDAIAELSISEQRHNELTVQVALERTANTIAIANHRREILKSLDNLEIANNVIPIPNNA